MKPFNRIDNPKTIDNNLVEHELKSGKEVIIQFADQTYSDAILAELNALCSKHDESLCIRFYGHYGKAFDCRTVLKIPNVKGLYVDCLQSAENILALTELLHLRKLSIGIFELQETEILGTNNFKKLTELIITETRTKAFNLEYLRDYRKLKSLRLGGHTKNIDAIGNLCELELLSLNSINRVSLQFINSLTKLKTLSFILGSRENINEIEENEIENLEVVRIRGLNDLAGISKFSKLQTLKIEDEKQLSELHFSKVFPDLKDLKIINCKTLTSVTGLKHLPQLETLVISRTNVNFEEFMQQDLPETLKTLGFYTFKTKADSNIKAVLEKRGYRCR